jgi:predicted amidohydrolase
MNSRPLSFAAVLFLASLSFAAPLGNWREWSPRDDIAPKFSRESETLSIETRRSSDFGAWETTVSEIKPAQNYRFSARYKARNVQNEKRSVIPRLEWLGEKGAMARPPEYALSESEENGWRKVELITTAPENSRAVKVQLGFGFAANARILWEKVSLEPVESSPKRTVRAITVFHRPRGTKSAADSVEQFCQLVRQSAAIHRPDLVCLPEGITVVGTGKTYWEVGEPIPGPATERLSSLARETHSYVVAGIYEREGDLLYNTAVLVGRDGKLVGKYRKTHLPREEWEAGITPGESYPVFQTDFGKVGLIVCWDVQFPEPSRAMARQGAEILLLPIWGGNETLAKARAIENHVFLLSSSYDMKTFIVDPTGSVLAEATAEQPVAFAELPLDRKYYQPWLGDMKHRTWKERRPDIPVD